MTVIKISPGSDNAVTEGAESLHQIEGETDNREQSKGGLVIPRQLFGFFASSIVAT
jgi:hypothetical protein